MGKLNKNVFMITTSTKCPLWNEVSAFLELGLDVQHGPFAAF